MRAGRKAATVGLYVLLGCLFGCISSAILGSWVQGFGVVLGGVTGLALLGLFLGVILFLVVRVPVPGFPLIGMARRNLKHQAERSVFGLVALFVGVVSIGFAAISIDNARNQTRGRNIDMSGVNLRIYSVTDQEAALLESLNHPQVNAVHVDYSVDARVRTASDSLIAGLTEVVARREHDLRWNLTLVDSAVVGSGQAAFVGSGLAARNHLAVGDELRLVGDGAEVTVRLAGIFAQSGGMLDLGAPPNALIVPFLLARQLGEGPMALQANVGVEETALGSVAEAVGAAVPTSVVIGKDALRDAINRILTGLFWFVIAVAGLALVAGAVLIANAVGLSMLERKRELGVLKAIGYSSGQVLWTVVLENLMLGLIGSGTGILGLLITVGVVNQKFPAVALSLGPVEAISLILVATGLAVGSATLVAWHPTHVRPQTILRGL